MGYNLLMNGVYWGYDLLTNLLLPSWDIQVVTSYDSAEHVRPKNPRADEGSRKRWVNHKLLAKKNGQPFRASCGASGAPVSSVVQSKISLIF